MRNNLNRASILFCFICLVGLSFTSWRELSLPRAAADEGKVTLSGMIRGWRDGKVFPIEDAVITASRGKGQTQSTKSRAEGNFELKFPAGSPISIFVEKDGFADGRYCFAAGDGSSNKLDITLLSQKDADTSFGEEASRALFPKVRLDLLSKLINDTKEKIASTKAQAETIAKKPVEQTKKEAVKLNDKKEKVEEKVTPQVPKVEKTVEKGVNKLNKTIKR